MKTKSWALLLGSVFVLLAALVLLQSLQTSPAAFARVYADGRLVQTLDLSEPGEYRVESAEGWNLLRVQSGKLAVTAASCPDGDCISCGAKNANPPIVCLPNRISVQFSDEGTVDGVVR